MLRVPVPQLGTKISTISSTTPRPACTHILLRIIAYHSASSSKGLPTERTGVSGRAPLNRLTVVIAVEHTSLGICDPGCCRGSCRRISTRYVGSDIGKERKVLPPLDAPRHARRLVSVHQADHAGQKETGKDYSSTFWPCTRPVAGAPKMRHQAMKVIDPANPTQHGVPAL